MFLRSLLFPHTLHALKTPSLKLLSLFNYFCITFFPHSYTFEHTYPSHLYIHVSHNFLFTIIFNCHHNSLLKLSWECIHISWKPLLFFCRHCTCPLRLPRYTSKSCILCMYSTHLSTYHTFFSSLKFTNSGEQKCCAFLEHYTGEIGIHNFTCVD